MIATVPHPNVFLGFGWSESHAPQNIVKAIVPTLSRGFQSVLCLADDQGVSGELPKLCTCDEANLLGSASATLQVCISDAGIPQFQSIEFGQECDDTHTKKRNDG